MADDPLATRLAVAPAPRHPARPPGLLSPSRACLALLLLLLGATAHAENITVGVFAPSAPFPSTAASAAPTMPSRLSVATGIPPEII